MRSSVLLFGFILLSCRAPKPIETHPIPKPPVFVETGLSKLSLDDNVKVEAEFKVEMKPEEKCPAEMKFVEGEFCPEVKEECDKWLDPPGTKFARCKKFKPTVCVSKMRVHKAFCIDTDEYTDPGEMLPKSNVSWEQAKSICEEHGKQLCSESDWTYACEKGENDTIHAHTTGPERPSDVCNLDLTNLLNAQGKLNDYRKPVSELLKCVNSTTGTRNMNGNNDEWTVRDLNPGPYRSALKGSWWFSARARCRPATVSHSETNYWSISVSFRCCSMPY